MGGDYYDREMPESVVTSSSQAYSEEASSLGQVTEVHSSMKPLRWTDDNLVSDHKNPIIFALDITGSMGEWAKIIYDKMPMFYGQIMMQNYLEEPAISFCAIGDHTCDDVPLQVTEFGQGKAIDQLLSKMVLWKSGNGNEHESYELAAYFYSNNVDLLNPELPFFFVTGDEGFFERIEGTTVQTVFGKGLKQEYLNSVDVWNQLMKKFNVFHIHKPYNSANYEKKIHEQWINLLGAERVLDIHTPKACVDVILGAIALTSGRSLDSYINDMKARGQSEERITETTQALIKYSKKLISGEIIPVTSKGNPLDNQPIPDKKENPILEHNYQLNEEEIKEVLDRCEKLILEDLDDEGNLLRNQMKQLVLEKSEQIPREFVCPITEQICFDPVMTCDGRTFERKAIECWLEKTDISPLSGLKLESKVLLPNFALKQIIRDYVQSNI